MGEVTTEILNKTIVNLQENLVDNISNLQTNMSNVYTVLNNKIDSVNPNATVSQQSIYQNGHLNTWLNNSGDSHCTRYIPSNVIRPATAVSMAVQKISDKLPSKIGGQTMSSVSDENNIFNLLSEGTGGAIGYNQPDWGTGPGSFVKIDKKTGSLLQYRTPIDIFQSTDPDATVVTRSAASLLGDYLYLTSSGIGGGCSAVLAKLRKSDLSTVWTINCLAPEDVKENKNIRDCLAFEHNNGKILITIDIATTLQYGGRGDSTDYKHNYGHFTTQGGALCIEDLGDSAVKLWEWTVCPKKLIHGDKVPDESFIDGKNEMEIIYPLVTIDDYDSTNYVGTDDDGNMKGVKGFLVDENTAGTVTLDLLTITGEPGPSAELLGEVGDIKAQGTYTFNVGDKIFDSSLQIFKCSGVLDDAGTIVNVPGSHIFRGQTLIKKIQKGRTEPLDFFEAYNMNYYGSGSYAPVCFDEKLGRVYITTANGHAQPYEDGKELGKDLNLADLTQKYEFAIRDLYRGLKTSEQVQEIFQEYKDAVMIRKNLPKSPRWRRFLVDSVVALNALTGELIWADGARAYDPFTWQEDKQPQWRSILRGNNGDIVTGATLITLEDGTRRIHSGDKSAFSIMHYPDAKYTATHTLGDISLGYNNGIKSMNMLYDTAHSPVYEIVGASGNQGGCLWGGCSNGDVPHAIYVTHQINAPFGSHILRQLNDGPNKDVPGLQEGFGDLDAKLGFITDKVVENSEGHVEIVRDADGKDTMKRLIPFATGYLAAVDASTGKTKWICPLSSTKESNQEFLADDSVEILPGDSGIPIISDQGAPSMFGSVVVVGMASGKVHFVDGRNGKMLKTMSFPEGCANGISGTSDTLYIQPGWNKWGLGQNPQSEHMVFITPNGL